jgi:uncharacterized membrane protein
MKTNPKSPLIIAGCMAVLLCGSLTQMAMGAQAEFITETAAHDLNVQFSEGSMPLDLSDDGSCTLIQGSKPLLYNYFGRTGVNGYWTTPGILKNEQVSWITDLQDTPGVFAHEIRKLSGDGSTVVGSKIVRIGFFNTLQAPVRYKNGKVELLGYNPQDYTKSYSGKAFAVSFDGSVVVGQARSQGFMWNEKDRKIKLLGHLHPTLNRPGLSQLSKANDVSGDGSVIVGDTFSEKSENKTYLPYSGTEAFRYESGKMIGLGGTPDPKKGGKISSSAIKITRDGSVIVGKDSISGLVLWKKSSNYQMKALGRLPGFTDTIPCGVGIQANQTLVIGNAFNYSRYSQVAEAIVADETLGIRSFRKVLTETYGIDLAGWKNFQAIVMTPDGSKVIGYGTNPQGKRAWWMVTFS